MREGGADKEQNVKAMDVFFRRKTSGSWFKQRFYSR